MSLRFVRFFDSGGGATLDPSPNLRGDITQKSTQQLAVEIAQKRPLRLHHPCSCGVRFGSEAVASCSSVRRALVREGHAWAYRRYMRRSLRLTPMDVV